MLMSAVSSILSHIHSRKPSPADVQARTQAQSNALPASGTTIHYAAAGGASSTTSASSSSGAITANDFLSLLVTEIQNQDPTSQTDPMTYITQLVGVNSLQQLLQINQTLTTATSPGGALAPTANVQSQMAGAAPGNGVQANASVAGAQAIASGAGSAGPLPLAVNAPATNASANAVAQAFAYPTASPQQIAPPTQVPLNPEVLRALEHSIPGAKLAGPLSGAQ